MGSYHYRPLYKVLLDKCSWVHDIVAIISGPTGGMSLDYPKGALNVKYSYLMEMRGEGTYGFIAPPSEILPTSLEQWAGLTAMAKYIMTIRN